MGLREAKALLQEMPKGKKRKKQRKEGEKDEKERKRARACAGESEAGKIEGMKRKDKKVIDVQDTSADEKGKKPKAKNKDSKKSKKVSKKEAAKSAETGGRGTSERKARCVYVTVISIGACMLSGCPSYGANGELQGLRSKRLFCHHQQSATGCACECGL